jgi:hypothetical protein
MEEQSLFLEFIGDSPTTRVLDYLMTERDLDFSITDLAVNAKIGRTSLYRIWDNLIKHKIIIHTRIIGKAKLFKLNKINPNVKKLMEIDDFLMLEDLKNRTKKTTIKMN